MIVHDYHGNPVHITKTDPHRHKYADAMAEYLDWLSAESMERGSGDAECPTGWFVQFGRRILVGDERGFVWVEVWPEEAAATQVYEAMDLYYSQWAYDDWSDEEERTEAQQMAIMDDCNLFLRYVADTAINNLEAFDYDRWVAEGRPKAYPG